MTGIVELAEQKGNKGYFAQVLIDAESDDSIKEHIIDFDEHNASNSRWRDAARFGFPYVLERIPKKSIGPGALRIHVKKIQGHPFDTNSVIIAYAAACALLRAPERSESDMVSLDMESGKIAFAR